MQQMTKTIRDLTIEEREDALITMAHALEGAAREALVEGNRQFAAISGNMAEAIFINADQLARDHVEEAEQVLEQAAQIMVEYEAEHPYRIVSTAIH
ncbi:hypothetical protein ASG19_03465 [Rhizobium sp. Leaf306]|uniref:hypothetical protein n=1 Tax=Rhizobium sp. Leaf306 TaxID=1736330 RepID=UPI000714F1BB|nr:hypothetical protein [Rhizobium sp. Leaf306]KQQ38136.1 hypothetical protein ASG19_03465 [Rhizobium sp. Leaf306]